MVCISLESTPYLGLSRNEFVAVISISLIIQFLGFSRQLLSGYHFWKFSVFFDFERWCIHVNWIEAQYF
jgi:hypothetical protein